MIRDRELVKATRSTGAGSAAGTRIQRIEGKQFVIEPTHGDTRRAAIRLSDADRNELPKWDFDKAHQ